MKNTFKFLLAAFCAVSLFGCGGSDNKETPKPSPLNGEFVGEWKLTAWSDDADGAIAAGKIQVYLQLDQNGTFTLYQNFKELGFTQLTGTYRYDDATKTLSGTYTDGSVSVAWGHSYTISDLSSSSMKLTASGKGDVATYTKTTIPSDLVRDTTKATIEEVGFRFL